MGYIEDEVTFEALSHMTSGDEEALDFLTCLLKNDLESLIIKLDKAEIYGRSIIVLFRDVCDEDIGKMSILLGAALHEIAGVTPKRVRRAISHHMYSRRGKKESFDFFVLTKGVFRARISDPDRER